MIVNPSHFSNLSQDKNIINSAVAEPSDTDPLESVLYTVHDPVFNREEGPLDPYRSSILSHRLAYSLVYDTLVKFDVASSQYLPNLAKDWFVSSDSIFWTIQLRENVFYHNGRVFNATNVFFTIQRLINSSHPDYLPRNESSIYHPLLDHIQSIEIEDQYQIKFVLKTPFAPFLSEISNFFILDASSFEGGKYEDPIGTGPYIYIKQQSNVTHEVYSYNHYYFGGLPPVDTIIAQTGNIDKGEIYKEEQFHVIPFVRQELENTYWHQQLEDIAHSGIFGHFNLNSMYTKHVMVRTAVQHLINHTLFFEFLEDEANIPNDRSEIRNSPFYRTISNLTPITYEVNKAEKLLNEAGFNVDESGTRFELTVASIKSRAGLIDVVAESLRVVGIEVKKVILNDLSEIYSGNIDFDIYINALSSIGGLDLGDAVSVFETGNIFNLGNYSSDTVDELIRLGLSTPVRQERYLYYKEILDIINKDVPHLNLYNIKLGHLIAKEFKDIIHITYDAKYQFLSLTQNQFTNHISHNFIINSIPTYFWRSDLVLQTLNNHSVSTIIEQQLSDSNEKFEISLDIRVDNPYSYELRIYLDFGDILTDFLIVQYQNPSGDFVNWYEYTFNSAVNSVTFTTSGNQVLRIIVLKDLALPATDQLSPWVYVIGFTGILIPISLIAFVDEKLKIDMRRVRAFKLYFLLSSNQKNISYGILHLVLIAIITTILLVSHGGD